MIRLTRDDIKSFLIFEEETSIIYPYAKCPDDVTNEELDEIISVCGNFSDCDTIYDSVLSVIG